MSSSPNFALLEVAASLGMLVTITGEVLLLVVVATLVRRHRPDAWKGLLAWAIVSLVGTILLSAASMTVSSLAARDEVEAMVLVQAVSSLAASAHHVVVVLLLIRGLVCLAQPPRPVTLPGVGAYR